MIDSKNRFLKIEIRPSVSCLDDDNPLFFQSNHLEWAILSSVHCLKVMVKKINFDYEGENKNQERKIKICQNPLYFFLDYYLSYNYYVD